MIAAPLADHRTHGAGTDRPNRAVACPHCGRRKDGCATYPSGWTICPRTESDRWAENGGGWLHPPAEGMPLPPPLPSVPAAPRQATDADLLDRVWRAAFAAMPLSGRHRDDLRRKGLTDDQIERHGCGSIDGTWAARRRVGAAAQDAVGVPIVGTVAGFARDPNGDVVLASPRDMSCRAIPVFDHAGRIVAARFRVDGATENKYRWASTPEGGATVDGNTPSWAHPARSKRPGTVAITEGEDKARVLADRLGCVALSVAGINNTAHLAGALGLLPDAGTVLFAFDQEADPAKAERVAHAEAAAVRRVLDARPDATVLQLQWLAEEGKGVDDALLAGAPLLAMPHPALDADQRRLLGDADHDDRAAAMERLAQKAMDERLAAQQEAAAARRDASLISRITARKTLGGDVGNTAAVRLANYAAWYAQEHDLQPGDPIPLVNTQIAKEIYDPDAGGWINAVSPKTIGTAVTRFVEKGVIETVPTEHAYVTPQGIERRMTVPGLVWRGRTELLERFANGTVYAEGEERRRGGKQEKRVALVCPNCGQTHVACQGCGELFDAVTRADDGRALLVNLDDPQANPDPDDHPRLVGDAENAGDDPFAGELFPDRDDPSPGYVLSGESTDPWNDPRLVGGADDAPPGYDRYAGLADPEREERRRANRTGDAIRLRATLRHRGVVLSIRRGRLHVANEGALNDRLAGELHDLWNELELLELAAARPEDVA